MRVLVLCLFIVTTAIPAQAQWKKRVAQLFSKRPVVVSSALQRQVARASLPPLSAPVPFQNSLVILKENKLFLRSMHIQGTGFVIQETYQGKTYLWGITATHYLFQKPALLYPDGSNKLIPISLVAQGSPGGADVSLFPLPSEMAGKVTPLKLASRLPKVNDELFSISMFDEKFHYEPERQVKEVSPLRLITSLQVNPQDNREGACGSPVFNKKGEVVGVHIGSSLTHQIGWVVPVNQIRSLLQAYHNQGNNPSPLILNGVQIGQINVNEFIQNIVVFRQNTVLQTYSFAHNEKKLDYAHLETTLDLTNADRVEILIIQNPFSSSQKNNHFHAFFILHDLKTGKTLLQQDDSFVKDIF